MAEKLEDGKRYRFFTPEGTTEKGTFEAESGNFFVGNKETFAEHERYFEAVTCWMIRGIDQDKQEIDYRDYLVKTLLTGNSLTVDNLVIDYLPKSCRLFVWVKPIGTDDKIKVYEGATWPTESDWLYEGPWVEHFDRVMNSLAHADYLKEAEQRQWTEETLNQISNEYIEREANQ